jgi:uncharacterized membrane protein SirB2
MIYTSIKLIHLTSIALSFSLFFVRGLWMLRDSPLLQKRWVKIAPHIIDSALLLSAISLAFMLGATPANSPWLLAKIIALLLYIVMGSIALKRGKTKPIKIASWIIAQGIFIYIVFTALTHNPQPWQAL